MGDGFGCICHAVEALPSLFDRIAGNPLLHKYNFAMAGRDGPVELHVSGNLEGNMINARPAGGSDGSVTVDGITLETFMKKAGIKEIDLLKMDVEGAEIGIFESISDATLSGISQITVEFHDFLPGVVSMQQVERIKERLLGLGFYVIKFSRTLNTDILFINRNLGNISRVEYWYIKYVVKYLLGVSRILQRFLPGESPSLPLRP